MSDGAKREHWVALCGGIGGAKLALGLAKDRNQRFGAATELAEALAAAVDDRLDGKLRARADALIAAHPWGTRL